MPIAMFLFWFCFVALVYCYLGYGLLLHLLAAFRQQAAVTPLLDLPELTIVIPSFNEGAILAQKIENTLALHYPPQKRTVLVVADGSTDDSQAILAQYPQVTTIYAPERKGKGAALNRAMAKVQTPFVLFTDANSLLNKDSLQLMMNCFAQENVGGVAGEKRIRTATSGVGDAEGAYWQYESWVKKGESKFNSVIGAAGELFALRTQLFKPIPEHMILDDLFISMDMCLQGYKIAYAANAFATEAPTTSLVEEEGRKVRIAAGAFQMLRELHWKLLLQQPLIAFQFISRRWLRWVVCPFALPLLFLSNAFLWLQSTSPFYAFFFGLQLLVYELAGAGWVFIKRAKKLSLATALYYFLFMNFCLVKGFALFIRNKQTVLWPKVKRQI
jgi:cellulose synthase/poly-beta-1,6-N-acetylglucosamine synthase-like glycosyltransferase